MFIVMKIYFTGPNRLIIHYKNTNFMAFLAVGKPLSEKKLTHARYVVNTFGIGAAMMAGYVTFKEMKALNRIKCNVDKKLKHEMDINRKK